MILTQAQETIARSRARFRVVCCGRRFGKTSLAITEIAGKAVFKKDSRIAYIAPTFQQARDIAWQMLIKILAPVIIDKNESRLELTIKTKGGGTSTIVLRGWEAIETLRGQKFDFLVIDEVASLRKFWVGWEEVLRPTLTDTRGETMFISTPKGFNWFYDLYWMNDPDYARFHFTTYDNPHIPKDEIDKAREEMTEDRFAQEYMADFRKSEGLVYKEFDRAKHVYDDEKNDFHTVIAGQDFGFTNPFALELVGIDRDSNFWVFQEHYLTGRTTKEIVELDLICQKEYNINAWYPDPAEPDRIEDMKRAGLNTRPCSKDVVAGIDTVRELLKSGRLHVHSSCMNLVSEFEQYHYRESRVGESEEPEKIDDHALDALRYAIYNYKPIITKPVERKQYKPMTRYGG